ncbi:MAG TPA: alpha-ketoacid dehydrogenase subunit beta [Candidatus Eisenbacteria bacterium]|jgi:2-oxoisovalerate dehydrogenase E1 component beta subunit|nr:alpha-ketoacid dehydrogenase subunit beta [Candidatus Eisenbacteria bacterium]
MAAITYLEAIRQGLFEEMRKDERVVCMGEDIAQYGGAFKVTQGLYDEFGPTRVINTPIAESAIVGAAIGMSMNGLLPVVEMQFIDFITCAFDQITSYAAKSRYRWGVGVPIVIRGPSSGNVHGGPFHSANPEMYFAHTPGLKVVEPATVYDAKGLLKAAIRDPDPVLYFEPKYLYRRIKDELPSEEYIVPIGRAAMRKEGTDITLVTYGAMLYVGMEAAEHLEKEGISLEVIDLRSILPFDEEMILSSVKKTSRCIILHEDTLTGGLGGEIAARIVDQAFVYLEAPVKRVTAPDTPVPFAQTLEEFFLPKASDVIRVSKELMAF